MTAALLLAAGGGVGADGGVEPTGPAGAEIPSLPGGSAKEDVGQENNATEEASRPAHARRPPDLRTSNSFAQKGYDAVTRLLARRGMTPRRPCVYTSARAVAIAPGSIRVGRLRTKDRFGEGAAPGGSHRCGEGDF